MQFQLLSEVAGLLGQQEMRFEQPTDAVVPFEEEDRFDQGMDFGTQVEWPRPGPQEFEGDKRVLVTGTEVLVPGAVMGLRPSPVRGEAGEPFGQAVTGFGRVADVGQVRGGHQLFEAVEPERPLPE